MKATESARAVRSFRICPPRFHARRLWKNVYSRLDHARIGRQQLDHGSNNVELSRPSKFGSLIPRRSGSAGVEQAEAYRNSTGVTREIINGSYERRVGSKGIKSTLLLPTSNGTAPSTSNGDGSGGSNSHPSPCWEEMKRERSREFIQQVNLDRCIAKTILVKYSSCRSCRIISGTWQ